MHIYKTNKELSRFLANIGAIKQKFESYVYFHIDLGDNTEIDINDLTGYISVNISDDDAFLMIFQDAGQALLLVPDSYKRDVADFDAHIHEDSNIDGIKTKVGSLHQSNHDDFQKILDPFVSPKDISAQIMMRRALRMENHIMVLDDDLVILKQMEKALEELGEVHCFSSAAGFIESYVDVAPDILFLDIHLKNFKGTDFVDKVIGTIDPHACIIMISSDTMKQTIMELRTSGTKGFMMKPFNREQAIQHVKRSPTYYKN